MPSEEAKRLYKKICDESDQEVAQLKALGMTGDQIYQHAWNMIVLNITKMYMKLGGIDETESI